MVFQRRTAAGDAAGVGCRQPPLELCNGHVSGGFFCLPATGFDSGVAAVVVHGIHGLVDAAAVVLRDLVRFHVAPAANDDVRCPGATTVKCMNAVAKRPLSGTKQRIFWPVASLPLATNASNIR